MRWKDARIYSLSRLKPKKKIDHEKLHRARRHDRRREQDALHDIAIRLLLGLKGNVVILEEHIECAEKKLGLPIIRLYLRRPDPSFQQRIARIYQALQKRS